MLVRQQILKNSFADRNNIYHGSLRSWESVLSQWKWKKVKWLEHGSQDGKWPETKPERQAKVKWRSHDGDMNFVFMQWEAIERLYSFTSSGKIYWLCPMSQALFKVLEVNRRIKQHLHFSGRYRQNKMVTSGIKENIVRSLKCQVDVWIVQVISIY